MTTPNRYIPRAALLSATLLSAALLLATAQAAGAETVDSCTPEPPHSWLSWILEARSIGESGRIRDEGPAVTDVTPRFHEIYASVEAGERRLPEQARDYQYFLVGGVWTGHYPFYMNANEQRLQSLGLETHRVPLHSEGSVERNARIVCGYTEERTRAGKDVVFLTHSKGGIDVTSAFAAYCPELKDRVRALIAIQPPYGGSAVPTDLEPLSWFRRTYGYLTGRLTGGDLGSLFDVGFAARRAFVAAHPYPTSIPTFSVATSRHSWASYMRPAEAYLRHQYGMPNDGAVFPADAEVPGSNVILLDDLDHADAVLPTWSRYDRGDLTEALVTLVFEQASPRSADTSARE